jgi:hypothetical protein
VKGAAQLMSSARTGTGSDHWCTPPEVVALVSDLGPIELDPCSNEHSIVGASRSFDGVEWDGLAESWVDRVGSFVSRRGLVYVNPPYSAMFDWAVKMRQEAFAGSPIVALIPARTDTRAWKVLGECADAIGLWRGRLKFLVDGVQGGTAPFPSALVGINVSQRRFRQVFSETCQVVIP